MASVLIYGGSFNPIHNGHTAVCQYVAENFSFDKIILMPVFLPPHKEVVNTATPEQRLDMCKLAVEDMSFITVSDYEIKKGGKNYTIDTIRDFMKQNPQDKYSIMIGTDMFLTFETWKEWENLGKLVDILVVSREKDDREALKTKQQELCKYGIHSKILSNPINEISSTQIRFLSESYKENTPVPRRVYEYMAKNKIYTTDKAVEEICTIIKPILKETRYIHSKNVERRGAELAKIHSLDETKVRIGCILHDICKNIDKEILLQMSKKCDIIGDINFEESPQLLHSFVGAEYIKDRLNIFDEDVINAVRYHTTGRPNMTGIEKAVYLADITSVERNYPDVDKVIELSNESLDKAMLLSLEFTKQNVLKKTGKLPCQIQQDALLYYQNKVNN